VVQLRYKAAAVGRRAAFLRGQGGWTNQQVEGIGDLCIGKTAVNQHAEHKLTKPIFEVHKLQIFCSALRSF
ncbi:MAG: hypothetical protein ACP5R4_10180, partial [Armatimonadota bacterium]